MFRHRNERHRWAARMLFVWLVAVGSGQANACLTSADVMPVGTSIESSAAESAPHQAATARMGGHDHAATTSHQRGGTTGHDSSPAKVNCDDFFSKASISMPASKSSLDDCRGNAVLPAAVVLLVPARPAQPAATWTPHPIAVAAQSIPIAYLRLAL